MDWLQQHWQTIVGLLAALGVSGTLEARWQALTRFVAWVIRTGNCEVDRIQWQEAEKQRVKILALVQENVGLLRTELTSAHDKIRGLTTDLAAALIRIRELEALCVNSGANGSVATTTAKIESLPSAIISSTKSDKPEDRPAI
jgi:hypothetical protein